MKRALIFRCAFSAATFVGIMLFLWLGIPQYLLYHEQYQLFLFTGNYFVNSVTEPGGLANYISEFIVQFYYVPLYGAVLTAFVLTLTQMWLGLSCRRGAFPDVCYALAAIPSVIFLAAMADENVLLSYAVALMLTSLFIYAVTLIPALPVLADTGIILGGFILLYWIAGPMAIIFIVAAGILRRAPLASAISLVCALAVIAGIHFLWFEQYPMSRMLQGINYYRVPGLYPGVLYAIATLFTLLPLLTLISPNPQTQNSKRQTQNASILIAITVALFAIIYVPASFQEEKSRLLSYDSLVRQGDWQQLIKRAHNEQPHDVFSLQALNLALGMTGQLTETMFRFPQNGLESLIGKSRLDNTTQLITAEALYRLGLTNIAFSTTFDLQEAIMNDRKSGRMMKRMAECMIINGNYPVAAKYIGLLKESLFYAPWARHAETLLYDDEAVERNPVYGPLRRNAFRKVAFYDYTQLDKILAMLAVDSGGTNPLAWQYFCAAALLKGDLSTLAGVYNSSAQIFGSQRMPKHVEEAMAMYWTFTHDSFDSVPFPLSRDVMQQTAALARAAMRSSDNPKAWEAAAPASYGVYFLKNSRTTPTSENQSDYLHTHE